MSYISLLLIFIQIIISSFNISIIFLSNKKEVYIDIDNHISEYENDCDFSNFTTDIKLLAFYIPEIKKHYETQNNNHSFLEYSKIIMPIHKTNNLPQNYKNEIIRESEYYQIPDIKRFLYQIELAKSHGIYGFAIYYNLIFQKQLLKKFIVTFLNNKTIEFHFLLILNFQRIYKEENINENKNFVQKIIKDIKDYLVDFRYIKINKKPALGIYEPEKISKLEEIVEFLRKKSKEFGIGEIFIILFKKKSTNNYFSKLNLFDAYYEFPTINNLKTRFLNKKKVLPYSQILYKNAEYKDENLKLLQFRGNMPLFDENFGNNESYAFDYYSPEQFYILNKIFIEWTVKKYDSKLQFIFINSLNEWNKGKLFENDKKYGYSLLNSLSKALFNLSYINNYNLINLNKSTTIAIQAHVYYEDLISEIIQKTNNIPVSFDLYVSTDSEYKKKYITNYILNHSIANKFEIGIFNNKGRDVLPLLIQLRRKIKKYKYFCHIHTKKSLHNNFGDEWRNYLFNNLLGDKAIISEILTEFEDKMNLGIIFPEIYYKVFITYGKNILGANLKSMESVLKKIAPYLKISIKNLDFPMGNMFWAKVKSVFQIFHLNLYEQFPKENKQIDGTIMHGIERIWIYLVKYNHFYYKKIFKHL